MAVSGWRPRFDQRIIAQAGERVRAEMLDAVGANAVGPRHAVLATGERPDQAMVGVENVERDLLPRLLHPVVDHRAIGGILSRRMGLVATPAAPGHSVGVFRLEQVSVGTGYRRSPLPQRRDIVENPEAATVRCRDQVAVLDREVVNRHDREVEPERLPVPAIVEAHPHAALGTGEEQSLSNGILAHAADEFSRRQSGVDPRPGGAVVRCPPDVGCHVLQLIAIGGDVGRSWRVVRGFDRGHAGEVAELLRRDAGPRHAGIAGDVQQAIVRAHPDQPGNERRFRRREDGGVVLGRGLVGSQSTGNARGFRIVAGQVGRNRRPVLAFVQRLEEAIPGSIQQVRVVRRHEQRGSPLKAVLRLARGMTVGSVGPDVDGAAQVVAVVDAK